MSVPTTHQAFAEADGINVFYRYALPAGVAADSTGVAAGKDAPTVVLLHGFPASSFMFRNLIPLLAQRGYRVVAPDLPAFGFTEVPAARNYSYTFASLAVTFAAFVEALQLTADGRQMAVYIFDYGSPTTFRYALNQAAASSKSPIGAIITQNGNAYTDGLGADFWAPIKNYWASGPTKDAAPAVRAALGDAALTLAFTKYQYVEGMPHGGRDVPPETYHLDQALMERPGNKDLQLDLLYDYQTNVALYPQWQAWLRSSDTPVLAIWGKHDPAFIAPGAEAYARDVRRFELQWLDAGHFALETNEPVVAEAIDSFLKKFNVFA